MSCCDHHQSENHQHDGHDCNDCENHDHGGGKHDHDHQEHDGHDHQGHDDHDNDGHDHISMMASPEAAQDFLRRFFIVTFLLVPLLLFSDLAVTHLGVPDFAFRALIEFGLATIIFYFGIVFFEHARHEIIMRKYGMMTLVSLAVGAGYLFSAASTFIPALEVEFYLEISTLVWVLLFGHYLEARSSSAAGNALQEVAKLLPQTAHLIHKGDEIREVHVDELEEKDEILVRPGEKVAADGVIVSGHSSMDEAVITGESKPISKKQGDRVVAGSIALDGSIQVKLDKVGDNSTVGQIKQLITQAQKTKPQTQMLADKASRWLTFTALVVALLTILIWTVVVGQPFVFALTLAITVLVIACPHALGLAIPTVTTITTTLATKHGLFIKDLGKLEKVKDIDYIIMDKTGTLTKGEFGVTGVEVVDSQDKNKILQIAGSLESHSSHVIALAIVEFAKESAVELKSVTSFKNVAGKGVAGQVNQQMYYVGNRALMEDNGLWTQKADQLSDQFSREGKTVVFVANHSKVMAGLTLADEIKPESYQAVADLHTLGVKVAMLTGDNQQVAASVADELGVDTYYANILPEDKYKHVKQLQDEGNVVMMVGDGVNDAPALTQADVGVAIGAGTEVAVEAGDVVLTRSNPQDVVSLVVLGRKTYRKMVENLVWATGYNVFAIPAAAGVFAPFGFFLSPGVGAFLMSLSSVIVVINAFRLKKVSLQV